MARSFNGSSDYYILTTGVLGARLNGAAVISMAAWVNFSSVSTTTGFDNRAFQVTVDGVSAGLILSLDGNTVASKVRLRVSARSRGADSVGSLVCSSDLTASTWVHIGGVVDVGAATITGYINGVSDGTSSPTFGAAVWTLGTPSGPDGIGAGTGGSNPMTGSIADVGLWTSNIGSSGFARLAAGERPTRVSTSSLVACVPLTGGTEGNVIGGGGMTVNNAPALSAHPGRCKPLFGGAGVS